MPKTDQNWGSQMILEHAASAEVSKLTQRIALLMRGIRETDVAVLGAILVEPKATQVMGNYP